MTRLTALNPEEATGKTKELFTAIEAKFGIVPNMMRTMGNSSALLEGYLNLNAALSKGTLGAKNSALIAMAVAQSNGCDYCLSVHNYLGINLGHIDAETLNIARNGDAANAKTDAALKFAKVLVSKKGQVNDEDMNAVKNAGFTEGEIGEIVGHVGLNILTNYFNNTAKTEIEFPLVSSKDLVAI